MQFYLGPAGDLQALPVIEDDAQVDASSDAPEAVHTSSEGAETRDILGRRRGRWSLSWVFLTRDEADLLDALRMELLGSPLYLVDPTRPNKAPHAVAVAGRERRSTEGWAASFGTLDWVVPESTPPGTRARSAIAWTRTTTAAGDLSVGRALARQRMPLLPGGGSVSVAALVRRTSSAVAVAPGWDWWDAAGTLTSTFGAAVSVAADWSTTLTAAAFTPPAGTVLAAPAWRIASGQAATTVQIAGVRYGHGTTPPAWSTGRGAAQVWVDDLSETEVDDDPSIDVTMSLREK